MHTATLLALGQRFYHSTHHSSDGGAVRFFAWLLVGWGLLGAGYLAALIVRHRRARVWNRAQDSLPVLPFWFDNLWFMHAPTSLPAWRNALVSCGLISLVGAGLLFLCHKADVQQAERAAALRALTAQTARESAKPWWR